MKEGEKGSSRKICNFSLTRDSWHLNEEEKGPSFPATDNFSVSVSRFRFATQRITRAPRLLLCIFPAFPTRILRLIRLRSTKKESPRYQIIIDGISFYYLVSRYVWVVEGSLIYYDVKKIERRSIIGQFSIFLAVFFFQSFSKLLLSRKFVEIFYSVYLNIFGTGRNVKFIGFWKDVFPVSSIEDSSIERLD